MSGGSGDKLVEPGFLDCKGARLFYVYHRPPAHVRQIGNVLCVPPFNEEMNRCRSMITLQARALTSIGFGLLLVDLLGTGDSSENYVDARWDLWLNNLQMGIDWLQQQPGGCQALLGIRLGAILAAQVLQLQQQPLPRLAMWQPVVDGRMHLTQFMRVRIAANLDRSGIEKETTSSMRAQLAQGRALEIAGYELHPELVTAIDNARLADFPPLKASRTLWLEQLLPSAEASELLGSAPPGLAASSQRVVDVWKAAGVRVDVLQFAGPAFWQQYERVTAPELVSTTTKWMAP